MNEERLLKLLDFSQISSTDTDKVEKLLSHCRSIATELLLNWKIKSAQIEKKSFHSIEAIEFYLIIPGVFEDDSENKGAAHKRVEQLSNGTFYAHTKSKKDWTHPIFNRHGVDITCGNKNKGIYGGILLRHLGGLDHKDGSGRALRVLLRGDSGHKVIPPGTPNYGWSSEEKKILEDLNNANIFTNKTGISLIYSPRTEIEKYKVVSGKRIGIDKTDFADYELRFYIEPSN